MLLGKALGLTGSAEVSALHVRLGTMTTGIDQSEEMLQEAPGRRCAPQANRHMEG
jgi:hypothetical protein